MQLFDDFLEYWCIVRTTGVVHEKNLLDEFVKRCDKICVQIVTSTKIQLLLVMKTNIILIEN